MYIYFSDGYPSNHTVLTDGASFGWDDLVMTPEVISVSPNKGSVGGTKIVVNAQGVGPLSDFEVVALIQAPSLIDAFIPDFYENICDSLTVEEYGVITCITKHMEISSEIYVRMNEEVYGWKNRTTNDLQLECPEKPAIYTDEYWIVVYNETHGIEEADYYSYVNYDFTFRFDEYYLAKYSNLTQEDVDQFVDAEGYFNWAAYDISLINPASWPVIGIIS
jgi:hypothetical protein